MASCSQEIDFSDLPTEPEDNEDDSEYFNADFMQETCDELNGDSEEQPEAVDEPKDASKPLEVEKAQTGIQFPTNLDEVLKKVQSNKLGADVLEARKAEEQRIKANQEAVLKYKAQVISENALQLNSDIVIDVSSDEDEDVLPETAGAALARQNAARKEIIDLCAAEDEALPGPSSASTPSNLNVSFDDESQEYDLNNCGIHTDDNFNQPEADGRVLINIGHPADEPDIFLNPQLAAVVKPHQIGGIRFLYSNVIESISQFKTQPGVGCILAHSMGLGKTLQVISFIDVLLTHTPAKHVLAIVPINTIQNWVAEFDIWLPADQSIKDALSGRASPKCRTFSIHYLTDCKTLPSRYSEIMRWKAKGGVLLVGYEMFKIVTRVSDNDKPGKGCELLSKEMLAKMRMEIREALVDPGPDLVVCDEGHRIKNCKAATSLALKEIKTKRRIVLTGYPIQNNLLEYFCMVDFVRPNFLGREKDFVALFDSPIRKGQCSDSTEREKRTMLERTYVLCHLLRGCVQRRSHSILKKCLPKKHEHILFLRMTPLQKQLMLAFITDLRFQTVSEDCISYIKTNPIIIYSVCNKIWNHPELLYRVLKEGSSVIDDIDSDLPIFNASNLLSSKKGAQKSTITSTFKRMKTESAGDGQAAAASKPSARRERELDYSWAELVFKDYTAPALEHSYKMVLLFELIEQIIPLGERLLVFSQSLLTLTLIEKFLAERNVPETESKWRRGFNYYRLDGSTAPADREKYINNFNRDASFKLFLLSTRAGCLGINLVGANRIVVFDSSWNPCHDAQAACRIYRYGQQRECYIYRLVCDNSLEAKIYKQQISKQGLSHRVVDEINPTASFSSVDIRVSIQDLDKIEEPPEDQALDEQTIAGYEDSVLRYLCSQKYYVMTKAPLEHESLLLDHKQSKLSGRQKRAAIANYQFQKEMADRLSTNADPYNYGINNYGATPYGYGFQGARGANTNGSYANPQPSTSSGLSNGYRSPYGYPVPYHNRGKLSGAVDSFASQSVCVNRLAPSDGPIDEQRRQAISKLTQAGYAFARALPLPSEVTVVDKRSEDKVVIPAGEHVQIYRNSVLGSTMMVTSDCKMIEIARSAPPGINSSRPPTGFPPPSVHQSSATASSEQACNNNHPNILPRLQQTVATIGTSSASREPGSPEVVTLDDDDD